VTAYFTGIRLGELLAIEWEKDWEQEFITLYADETKGGHARAVPIFEGDMKTWLLWAQQNGDGCPRVFHRDGMPIKEFRGAWKTACKSSGVNRPKVSRSAPYGCSHMRRMGISQVVRICASPDTGPIPWNAGTTLSILRISDPRGN
jgi:integrase